MCVCVCVCVCVVVAGLCACLTGCAEHHETVRTATASLRTDIEQLRGELDGVLGRVRASIVAAAQCTRLAPPHKQHQPAAGAAAAAECAGFMVRYDGSIPVAVLAERALQHAEAVLRGRQSLSRAALVSGTSSTLSFSSRVTRFTAVCSLRACVQVRWCPRRDSPQAQMQ